jgi:hypothetical protein
VTELMSITITNVAIILAVAGVVIAIVLKDRS